MKQICVVNIGNTHTRIVLFDPAGTVLETREANTCELAPDMIPAGMPVAIASVVPSVSAKLADRHFFQVTRDCPGIPDLSRVESECLGADRIANIVQLSSSGTLPAMTIDCGTAVNCEIVDETGYRGGAIFPGRLLLRKSLNLFTAQLPVIPFFDTLPESMPGTCTLDDMRWGIDSMLLAGIADFLQRARAMFPGKKLRIVACGGDREFFIRNLPGIEDGTGEFTERGILSLWQQNGAPE